MFADNGKVQTWLEELSQPPADTSTGFYAISLGADDDGNIFCETQTCWTGYADEGRRVEMRQASLVTTRLADLWTSLGTPGVYVHNLDHLMLFFLRGGNALVVPSVATEALAHMLVPEPAYRTGQHKFVSSDLVGPDVLKRKTPQKLRMKVIQRDRGRCRVCGRHPDNYLDLELHVHHIRPREDYGLTDMANLITLCQTCHKGLDPHYAPWLFGYLEPSDSKRRTVEFLKGLANYQRVTQLTFDELDGE